MQDVLGTSQDVCPDFGESGLGRLTNVKSVGHSATTMSRTAKALAEHQRQAALRAAEDPAKLARAVRVIRAAIERQRLTLDELNEAVTQ